MLAMSSKTKYDSPAVTAEQLANGGTVLSSALCGFLRHRGVIVHTVSVDLRLDVFHSMTSRCTRIFVIF